MKSKYKNFLRTNLLTILTILGVVMGVVVAMIIRSSIKEPFTPREVMYVSFVGDIFLNVLKALIIPLIVSSLIAAISGLDLTLSRRIGGHAITYYITTTIMAVILGIILVSTIRPGIGNKIDNNPTKADRRNVTTPDTLMDLIRNMFPPNLVQATMQQYQTVLIPPDHDEPDLTKWKIGSEYYNGMNILGLVVASVAIGIALSSSKNEATTMISAFQETSAIMMKITRWVIWVSPLGVFFLICAKVIGIKDLAEITGKLGFYFLTVAGGVLIHGFICLPIVYFLFTRKNPYTFLGNMGHAMITSFGTASSSATLPVTLGCLENLNGVDPRVSRFVIPIGATINMDGTALYEAVAAIFIAQLRGVALSFGQIVAVSITATAASIGAAGIPHAGLVTLVMVLDTVGLPAEDVSIIIAVDWLLDRIRTMVNVMGDSLGAGIVAHLNRHELHKIGTDNNNDIHRSSITNGHNTVTAVTSA